MFNNFNNTRNLNKTENMNIINNSSNTMMNQTQRIVQNDKLLKEYNEKTNNNEEFELKNLLNLTEDVFESLINSRLDSLKDVFLRYAKLGEKLNTARISLSSFIKFLKDCGVLPSDKNNLEKNKNSVNFSNSKMQISTQIKNIITNILIVMKKIKILVL